jgi:5-methylcytosine-specific restriction endonuclease McrA
MAKSYAKTFYKSKAWQKCRQAYIQDRILCDGGLCMRCKDKTGYAVHHIQHITPQNINNPDITLNHNNLEYLCKECHDLEPQHWKDSKQRARTLCYFDDNGNAIEPNVDRRKRN